MIPLWFSIIDFYELYSYFIIIPAEANEVKDFCSIF